MQRAMIPFVGLLCLAVLFLTGASARPVPSPEDQPAKVAVSIDNFSFAPNTVTVAAGTTVVWTNQDDVPHNATSNDKAFKSPALDTGEKWEYTFKTAGTFNYYCTIHPKMTGTVVVK